MKILVTGAFSYTGSYIAKELMRRELVVTTITSHPDQKSSYFDQIKVYPYNFDNQELLVDSLRDIDIFINTYWIRFPYKGISWEDAIQNSEKIISACKEAKVKKFIHISVTNPSTDSPYPYFRGKAEVEQLVVQSGLNYIIIRPALIFETDDILINNIAYLLQRSPIFAIFGSGKFKIQPVLQSDLVKVIVDYATNSVNDQIVDVLGPNTYTFKEIVKIIKESVGSNSLIVPFPGVLRWIPFIFSKFIGWIKRDVILTRHEMDALRNNLLLTDSVPLCQTDFELWCKENGSKLGQSYQHEIHKHYK